MASRRGAIQSLVGASAGWLHSWERRVRFEYLATTRMFRFGLPKQGRPMREADRFAGEYGRIYRGEVRA